MNIHIPEWLITFISCASLFLMLFAFYVFAIGFLTDMREKYLKRFFRQSDIMEFRPVYLKWVKDGKPKDGE